MSEPKFDTPHYSTAQSETIQALRDGPKTNEELPYSSAVSHEQKQYVRRLAVPQSHPDAKHSVGQSGMRTVYYLYGDERRAVRKLIDERSDYFRGILDGDNRPLNALTSSWSDALVQIAVEEWAFREAQAGGEP